MAWNVKGLPEGRAELKVDEEIARAYAQLTEGTTEAVMSNNDTLLYLILGGFILLVIIALAVTYGRIKRRREMLEDGQELFEERLGSADAFSSRYDDLSTGAFGKRESPVHEPGPLTSESPDDLFADQEEPEPAENVVPLRVPEAEPREQAQPLQRTAQGGDRPYQMANLPEEPRDYDYGATGRFSAQTGQSDWDRSYPDQMSGRDYEDDDAPFVAPFIRDYIEESERRQHARLDDLREDMRRQLSGIREEQSSRLDLFLNSIDRKLAGRDGLSVVSGDDSSSTRRRIDSLSSLVDRMNEAFDRQSDRLTELSRAFDDRLNDLSPVRADLRSVHDDLLSFRRDVEANTAAIGQLRDNFNAMKEDFSRMERTFLERASSDQGLTMRLAEVVRGTLEDDEFELNAKLSNGHVADCVIILRGGRSRVAIDGGFPIEAFNRLPSRDAVRRNLPQAKAGEDEFRRTVLRSIFACADHCIVAGETADSAILFLPSEAAYTILHDRFPDLVRDSHRARVWLTSPSTLMGTLNLLHNVLPHEEEPLPPRLDDEDEEGPFYAGPESDYEKEASRAAEIEARLQALREEEQALAEELVRSREPRERHYRSSTPAPRRGPVASDFETRLERFSFDIDDTRTSFGGLGHDDEDDRRSFKSHRDDDLR